MEASLKNFLYDNPELYEQIYDGSGHEIPRMCAALFGGTPATVLDIGCGTGRDLEFFAELGTRCSGVDYQPNMIAYARAQRPDIDFQVGDMRKVRLGTTFDVITCVGWALCNLHTPEDIDLAMATFAAHARPGTLLFLHLPNAIGNDDGHGMRHRFEIDTPSFRATAEATYRFDRRRQLLTREAVWSIPGEPDRSDFARFRMLFPMELEHYLTGHGFSVAGMYDNTAAADSELDGSVLYVAARFSGEARV
ncbi:class I SAM-dependent methyltransferase [Streptomyces chryseus]|uniref:class I SAM-dependent methyltransferase n=1 Tax=Streptomyces chryseus TaxID=68186 RepID=UPI00110FB7BE|nr:class I SAM-dependent methyltransferase [Streptomyces chryseus]GGX40958.1 methyltransferase [Streptomyces chryseus]